VALALACERVAREVADVALGNEFDHNNRAERQVKVKDAKESAKAEVWESFRFAVVSNRDSPESDRSRCRAFIERRDAVVLVALLNESVGAGYWDRNTGRRPSARGRSLACSINGSLTRLVDPDTTLKSKIVEFIKHSDFVWPEGRYERVWVREPVDPDEVSFETGVFFTRRG